MSETIPGDNEKRNEAELESQNSPCEECTEKWIDKNQWDCPWHMNVRRCDCY